MREILFRGIVLENNKWNGKWIYGDLIHNVDCLKIREQEIEINHIAKSFIIDENTLGQFTGLLDKNGNKIFEGDILKDGFMDDIYVVFYSEKHLTYMVRTYYYLDDEYSTMRELKEKITDYDISNWVIIGNIHDNKELENEK